MFVGHELFLSPRADAHYFGGALVASNDGTILTEYPLECEGVLLVDLERFAQVRSRMTYP